MSKLILSFFIGLIFGFCLHKFGFNKKLQTPDLVNYELVIDSLSSTLKRVSNSVKLKTDSIQKLVSNDKLARKEVSFYRTRLYQVMRRNYKLQNSHEVSRTIDSLLVEGYK